jgi:hypothetical protein
MMISSFEFGEFPVCPFKIAEAGLLFNPPTKRDPRFVFQRAFSSRIWFSFVI